MTRFNRSGHYRTNQHGTTFWVSSHAVSRDEWWLPASPSAPDPVRRPYAAADAQRPGYNITIPNRRCPVCNDPVFFFMDVHGGRVFFDPPLGPPWRKHSCTSRDDGDIPAFDDPDEIASWLAGRRDAHGPDAADYELALALGMTSSEARIMRRADATIAIVDMDGGPRAFVVEGAWAGRSLRRVYHRTAHAPDRPGTLDYLCDNLVPASITVVAEIPMPEAPTARDLAAIAEGALPEVEAWAAQHLPTFHRGPRVKLDGRKVGLAGRLGLSRTVLAPLAPWFDAPVDEVQADDEKKRSMSKDQIISWTTRVVAALDRSQAMKAHPFYRDVFVWLAPSWASTFMIQWAVVALSEVGRSGRTPRQMVATRRLPGRHYFQEIDEPASDEIRETRRSFDELAVGEHVLLLRWSAETRERQWLVSALNSAGIGRIMAALEREGVLFEFLGTAGGDPRRWGQQAILPDGTRLLVLLHLSGPAHGLAFARFGAADEDEAIPVETLFYAKTLAQIAESMRARC